MEHDKLGQRVEPRERRGVVKFRWNGWFMHSTGSALLVASCTKANLHEPRDFEQFRTGFPLMRWSFHLQLMNTLIFEMDCGP
jgi:hypothetical protein